MNNLTESLKENIKPLGLVFGDIGTSPIYTLTILFLLIHPTRETVLGMLSLVFWTVTTLVTMQYVWLAMSLDKKGEGGTIVLKEILTPHLKSPGIIAFISVLTFVGISFLIGDSVITPAISILSAVEGSALIPGLKNITTTEIVIASLIIAILLFSFQKKGTDKVAGAFGPIMLVWFLSLALFGAIYIIKAPFVVKAISPGYLVDLATHHPWDAFFALSSAILAATGGEAIYADMGHVGRKPIRNAWAFVSTALMLNYFGQGAYVIEHLSNKHNILFEMVLTQAKFFYVPFLVLSIIATVIASQAVISGMFSIVYQGITTRIMPLLRVEYTSKKMRSQIYIGVVNWMLFLAVVLIMIGFRTSEHLAAAYGLAVTITMSATSLMMAIVFFYLKRYVKMTIALLLMLVDLCFVSSNIVFKFPDGAYWALFIGFMVLSTILIYTSGQKKLYNSLKPIKLKNFLNAYNKAYSTSTKINGTAMFFIRNYNYISPYIYRTLLEQKIIYKNNIFVSLNITDEPYDIIGSFTKELADGLKVFEIKMGYMETLNIESVFQEAGIKTDVIFYGIEDIMTNNIVWKIFAVFKRITPSFVQFYNLTPSKLHGVITRVKM